MVTGPFSFSVLHCFLENSLEGDKSILSHHATYLIFSKGANYPRPLRLSSIELHNSRFTLLCSTDGHHAHNRSHLYNIFLIIIHPSQFTYGQKVNKHTFPIHTSSRVRQEVVWDIFAQNTSNHFSVHIVNLYGTSPLVIQPFLSILGYENHKRNCQWTWKN